MKRRAFVGGALGGVSITGTHAFASPSKVEQGERAWEETMPEKPTAAQKAFGGIAPALAAYTDNVLFGEVWERPGLSKRDRSLITVATLVALYRTNELPFHLKRALENGVTKTELVELITHLAFYSGWPTAATAVTTAQKVFEEAGA